MKLINNALQSNNPSVEIWADNVSLQPFTKEEWRSHQDNNIERVSNLMKH
jgi:hypothetical protein